MCVARVCGVVVCDFCTCVVVLCFVLHVCACVVVCIVYVHVCGCVCLSALSLVTVKVITDFFYV